MFDNSGESVGEFLMLWLEFINVSCWIQQVVFIFVLLVNVVKFDQCYINYRQKLIYQRYLQDI